MRPITLPPPRSASDPPQIRLRSTLDLQYPSDPPLPPKIPRLPTLRSPPIPIRSFQEPYPPFPTHPYLLGRPRRKVPEAQHVTLHMLKRGARHRARPNGDLALLWQERGLRDRGHCSQLQAKRLEPWLQSGDVPAHVGVLGRPWCQRGRKGV